jgi:N-acetylmuramoyl-L-alanine amidase-like protein
VILVPRATIWPGQLPTSTTGAPRPLLEPERPYLVVHYTGAGSWLDPDDTPDELRSIQNYAQWAGKPWEYNWVIDGQGLVFEYAGDYRAAHYADHSTEPPTGKNEYCIGVLLLVGFTGPGAQGGTLEQPTVPMTVAFRDLRAWLVATDRLAAGHELRGHRQMFGAYTACPGDAVMGAWEQFANPVPPPQEVEMIEVFYRNAEPRPFQGTTYPAGQVKYRLLENGKCRRISGDELADRGYPMVDINFGIAKSNAYLDAIEVTP